MNETPRQRRLATDFESLTELARATSAFRFEVSYRGERQLPESYLLEFFGPSLEKIHTPFEYAIQIRSQHHVRITLGPQYPRLMPSIQWITPIFHPNISSSGAVCLGGYSSFWVPSLKLDQLCEMLWDMLCFRNVGLESPYNRDAADWYKEQTTFQFPLLNLSLRHAHGVQKVLPPTVAERHPDGSEITFLD